MQEFIEFIRTYVPIIVGFSIFLATILTLHDNIKINKKVRKDENEMERNARKW